MKLCTSVGLLSGQVFFSFDEFWLAGSHGGGGITSGMNGSYGTTASQHDMDIRNWRRRCLHEAIVARSVARPIAATIAPCKHAIRRLASLLTHLLFSINFTAAQNLTTTLCGCLSKHTCVLLQQLLRYYTKHVQCIIWRQIVSDKKFHVASLCTPPSHKSLATPLVSGERLVTKA